MDEDLSKRLDALLNSPDGMEKIQNAMAAFGISPDSLKTPPEPPPKTESTETLPDLSGLLQLAPLLSNLGKDDQNTALLQALRPYLHGEREKRLEESMKMMKMLRLLPILKDKGVLK